MDKSVKFRIELESNGNKVLHNLSVGSEDFRKAIDDATSEVKHLGDVFGSLAEQGMVFSAVREAVLALQDAIGGLADEFNDFDEGMRKANTMAHVSGKELNGLKESIEDMAGVVPLAKRELAEGLYQVISNGVPKENWIDFLRASARSAVGGIAELGRTVTVTSTIIKNYALDWDRAGEIQDKIQTAAKNGVTSFEQLAAALPRVTGNAATLGVSIDELMATFATLTGVSGNTAEVSTQLTAVFTALVKPSGEAAEMAEQMGIRFDAAAIKAAGGMRNFLTSLRHDVEEYAAASGILEQEIYGRLFGSAESLRALTPLTGNLADAFTRNIDAMSDSAGTMDAAFDDMAGSGRSVEQLLKNQLGTMTDWAGRMASMIKPYVSFVAVAGQAVYGLTLMTQAFTRLKVSIAATTLSQKANIVVSRLAAVHSKIVASAQLLLSRAGYTAAAGTWALNAAVTVLYATLTMGIALVIEGIAMLFSKMGHRSEEAAGKMDILKESSDAFKNTFADR